MRRPEIVWTPVLAVHAAAVVLLVGLDVLLGGGLVQLLLVLAGLPWTGFALAAYGDAFALLVRGGALLNVVLHAWWTARDDRAC